MREFELLPNEEQIRDMAREYSAMLSKSTPSTAKSERQIDCGNRELSEMLYLTIDIEQALRRLYSLASKDNRESINSLIKLKKGQQNTIAASEGILPQSELDYIPYKAVSNYYTVLICDIAGIQEQSMLLSLSQSNADLTSREMAASIIVNKLMMIAMRESK